MLGTKLLLIWVRRFTNLIQSMNQFLEGKVMSPKEMITKEIDKIPEERLDELHKVIKGFTKKKNARKKGNLMTRLRKVKIHGPKDFAKNIDA